MGWLFAFLLLLTSLLLAFFLYLQWDERAKTVAKLRAAASKLAKLEKVESDNSRVQQERDAIARTYIALRSRVEGLANADEEKERVEADVKELIAERDSLASKVGWLRREHRNLTDEVTLAETGFYECRYQHDTSAAFKKALAANQERQKEMLKGNSAALCTGQPGATKAEREQVDKLLSLMLRSFNGECDAAVAKVRYNNFEQLRNRIEKAFATINRLGAPQGCELAKWFLMLKVEELQLTCEHAMKVQAEKEEQREIKEQMRQDALVARDRERATQEALDEERRRRIDVEKARRDFEVARAEQKSAEEQESLRQRVAELEDKLAEATAEKERAVSQAQLTRSGHVYVISNLGSFGENVYKIGMTRRLDPMDRVSELGDASVPFAFDVHAIISSRDAPALEAALHAKFSDRRLNLINRRKEFFHVTIQEIAEVVREECGDILLTEIAQADEFAQSEAMRRAVGKPLLSTRQMISDALHLRSPIGSLPLEAI